MNVRTYRARSMQEALALVRRELGPEAAVLHTREVRSGFLRRSRQIEVTASAGVRVPSRLPPRPGTRAAQPASSPAPVVAHELNVRHADDLQGQLASLQSMVESLRQRNGSNPRRDLPESMFRLFTDLIDADVSEELAREMLDRLRREAPGVELADAATVKSRIARFIEAEIAVAGPIRVVPGRRRLAALVGPTGVGKTTTIAKLAANYRLREKLRVGLITVDTYRIAAVEQLRTYADIIDLPMEVVSTPREMRQAVARLADLDLVLMDTAGRSPRDEVQIQELKSMLGEAVPDEVHLVLSACASAGSLSSTAQRFGSVGVTALVLTKLDESSGLGNLLPLFRACRMPLSYVTNGQSVPDDIEAADPGRLARLILGLEPSRR